MPKFSLPGKREVITTTNFFSNLCTGLRYNNLYSTLTPSESDTSSAPAGQSCAVRSFVLQPRPWQHCPTRSRAAHLRRLHRTSCSWRGSQTSPCTHATADSCGFGANLHQCSKVSELQVLENLHLDLWRCFFTSVSEPKVFCLDWLEIYFGLWRA